MNIAMYSVIIKLKQIQVLVEYESLEKQTLLKSILR